MGETTSGVNLSNYQQLLTSFGDQYGARIVDPGNAANSPIVDKISRQQPQFGSRMPLGRAPLSGAQIAVIRDWIDVSQEYPGVTIQSVLDDNGNTVGGVMFNALGASVNSCGTVTFPVRVTVADATGATHVIEIHAAGGTRFM